jgi:hypothetical protein
MIVPRRIAVLSGVAVCLFTGVASATAPPVGKLPKAQVTTVSVAHGGLVSVALPARATGLEWRLARRFDATVLSEVGEADVGANVVVIYKALKPGKATVVYALTKGETPKAYRAIEYDVVVR